MSIGFWDIFLLISQIYFSYGKSYFPNLRRKMKQRRGGVIMKRILAAAVGIALLGLLPLSAGAATLAEAGKSAVLMDVTTGTVLYEHNSHEALAPASVTKVMTMLLIMEAVDSGKIALTDTVTASEAAAAKGGSQIYLKAGETMSVSDMLKSIAVSSANDCACAMAELVAGSEGAFVEQMNQRAAERGLAAMAVSWNQGWFSNRVTNRWPTIPVPPMMPT